jgi:hypothetical protein
MPQLREPPVFVQLVSGSQPPLSLRHSSMSAQPLSPSPL